MTAVPTWLARRPYSLALLLTWRNAWRRSRAVRAAGGVAVVALAGLACWPAAGTVGDTLAENAPAVFAAAVILFAVLAARRRRRLGAERAGSWLAALPGVSPPIERAAVFALPALVALELLLGAVLVAAQASRRLPIGAAGALLLVLAAGGVAGFWAGWFLWRPRRDRTPPSRRAVTRRPRTGWASRPTLAPLGYWAAALTRWWLRPKISARWELLVLLALPMGISGAKALGAAGAGLVFLYLVSRLLAVIRVAFAASWWIAPTPIRALRFAVSVTGLALLQQAVICVLLLVAVDALGTTLALRPGIVAAIGWMLGCILVGGAACKYALRHRSLAASRLHRWLS
ncbi:MAG: hypothetical protein ACRETB_08040 [Steroidobacteraceae bacterium]